MNVQDANAGLCAHKADLYIISWVFFTNLLIYLGAVALF
jgi:hypothetical protein